MTSTASSSQNLIDVEADTPIYRTFRLAYFRQALTDRVLVLVQPHLWDDPFENLVSHCVITDTRGAKWAQTALASSRRPMHGQCWSLAEESDALWRIYSTVRKDPMTRRNQSIADEGIKVKSTAGSLLDALWRATPYPHDSCFLGKVRYFPEGEVTQIVVDEIGKKMSRAYHSGRGHAESLLMKRSPFDHEQEIRLIYVGERAEAALGTLMSISVSPNEIFEEVILDPRLHTEDVRDRQREFIDLGFLGSVEQSGLYQKKLFEVIVGPN